MPKQSTLPPDSREDQDTRYDPAQADYDRKFNEIVNHPDLDDLRQSEQDAATQPTASNTGIRKNIVDAEQHPAENATNNPMNYTKTAANKAGSKGMQSKGSLWKNRKLLVGLGFGGIGGGIVVMFLLLLPMKLNALITNATDAASQIPGYAAEHRTEYLMTRILATRMLQLNYGLDDKDIEPVFCKERGNIGCSLLATYTAQRISDTLGMDMVKLPNQTVRVTINAKGRQSLGGYARSWDVTFTRDWSDTNQGVLKTVKKIETHKEMRAYLKTEVNKKTKNTIARFVARRILMLKYGVRSWRAFEATQEKIDNKVADVKTRFKVGMYKNTIGKISPRYTISLACLFNGMTSATCEDLYKSFSSTMEPPGDGPKAGESQESYEKRKKAYETFEKIGSKIRGEIPEVPSEGMLNSSLAKIFSTKVLAIAGVVGVIMNIDMVMQAIHGVGDGVLDTVGFDMAAQAYTGLAFGDTTGVVPNWEKIKTGDLQGTDAAEVMNELGSLIDCDGSTLCAYENGYANAAMLNTAAVPTAGAASTGFSRECETSEGTKQIALQPGELVCPERKLYRNYAGLVVDNEWFKPLKQMSDVWTSSVGQVVRIVNEAAGTATGWVTGPILALLKPVTDTIGKQLEPYINWAMDTIFNPPSVGYDTTPANNYDALSGALHLEQWEMMKNGISDGQVLGGGGQYLSEAESQQILAYQQSEEQDNLNSQSTMAKLFDTSLKGSLAQQAVLQAPTNLSSLAKLPTKILGSLFHVSSTASAATTVTSSPFGLPNYSYKLNDSALTADPNTYTEDYCTESAAARDASLTPNQPGATVPVYTKTDPCALEKMVVGSLITPLAPDDRYAFPQINGISTATNSGDPGTCAENTKSLGVYDKAHDNGKQISVQLCELSSIKLQPGFYTDQDPALFSSGSGGLIVGASVSDQFQKLGEEALTANRQLMGKGIRSYEKQEYFYGCYISKKCNNGNLAAVPGTSNHENGTAVDFVLGSGDLAWLRANAGKYDLKELKGSKPEPWHWSP